MTKSRNHPEAKALVGEVLEELKIPEATQEEDDLLSVPHFIEVDLIASQRQLWRNTAVQARDMGRIARACGAKEQGEALDKEMRAAVLHIVEIDKLHPEAKARMREMDEMSEKIWRNQQAQKVRH